MKNTLPSQQILAQAEHICQQRNVRLTAQRREVLRLLTLQSGAITAYDLLDLLRLTEPNAKPPNVYRALDFLLEQGFIHRVESVNSYILCCHFAEPCHTSALLICDACGLVIEQTAHSINTTLQQVAREQNFTLHHSIVEAHGTCSACYQKHKRGEIQKDGNEENKQNEKSEENDKKEGK